MKHEYEFEDLFAAKRRRECFFGIGEAIAAVTAAISSTIAGGATALGIGAETAGVIGTVGAGVLEGAAVGAGGSALTGGDPLKGAEFGALTGGVLSGAGAAFGGATGAGAPGASAAGTAAPAGVSAVPDATAAASDLTGATGPITPVTSTTLGSVVGPASDPLSPVFTGAEPGAVTTGTAAGGGSLPGSVGAGAASGVPSAASGVNVPTSIAAPTPTPDTDLIGAGGTAASTVPTTGATANLAPASPTASLAPSNPPIATPAAPAAVSPGAGAAVTPPAAAAAPSSVDKFLADPGFSTGFDVLKANPTTALSVGALGAEFLMGNQQPPYAGQLAAEAKAATSQGAQLESYVNSGQLPPGLQQQVNTAAEAAKASIRSMYASRGASGSSAEQEDLGRVDQTMVTQGADMALKLYQAGVSQTQLGEQLYTELMNVAIQQDAALSSAIGNFAFAMAGGQRPLQPTGG